VLKNSFNTYKIKSDLPYKTLGSYQTSNANILGESLQHVDLTFLNNSNSRKRMVNGVGWVRKHWDTCFIVGGEMGLRFKHANGIMATPTTSSDIMGCHEYE